MKVAVVGTCASGKTSLVGSLRAHGYDAFAVAQEHSVIADLWHHQRPERVVYLDNSLATVRARRRDAAWPAWIFALQRDRLSGARSAADIIITTDDLTLDDVAAHVLSALRASQAD